MPTDELEGIHFQSDLPLIGMYLFPGFTCNDFTFVGKRQDNLFTLLVGVDGKVVTAM